MELAKAGGNAKAKDHTNNNIYRLEDIQARCPWAVDMCVLES